MLLAIFGSAWLLGNPNLILIAAVLPLLAAVTGGGAAGVAVELILVVLTWFVSQTAWGAAWAQGPGHVGAGRGGLLRLARLGCAAGSAANGAVVASLSGSGADRAWRHARAASRTRAIAQRLDSRQPRAQAPVRTPQGDGAHCGRGAPGQDRICRQCQPRAAHPAQHDHRLCRYHRPLAPRLRRPAAALRCSPILPPSAATPNIWPPWSTTSSI